MPRSLPSSTAGLAWIAGAILFAACGETEPIPPEDDGAPGEDAGVADAGPGDAGGADSGADAGLDQEPDAGPDAGADAGPGAGADAGPGAGVDAGLDAGQDAGRGGGQDAGLDAGPDAGLPDAGEDGGPADAGPADAGLSCGPGENLCGSTCVAETPASCGPTCDVCPGSANGFAVCRRGTCVIACDPGFTDCATGCCPGVGAERVDPVTGGGEPGSVAIDASGIVHVAYLNVRDEEVMYARQDGNRWVLERVGPADAFKSSVALALDSSGVPRIAWHDGTRGGHVYFARRSAGSWLVEQVEDIQAGAAYISLAVDGDDIPHLAYFAGPGPAAAPDQLRYARWTSSGWSLETPDPATGVGGYTSIAIDGFGFPHISYYDYGNDNLKYARFGGLDWLVMTVDEQGSTGAFSSIALDGSGNPRIAYLDSTSDDVRYAEWKNDAWVLSTAISTAKPGRYCKLVLDRGGAPHIVFHNYVTGDMDYAHRTSSGWVKEKVGDEGYYGAIALDAAGRPHGVYEDYHDLLHSVRDAGGWRADLIDPSERAGEWSSLALDGNSQPHIGYYAATQQMVRYARFDRGWVIEDVQKVGTYGGHTSLSLDSTGRPHLAYYDGMSHTLQRAVRTSDAWSIDTADATPYTGWYASLALDSADQPHISYGSLLGLKYAHRTAAGWQTETIDASLMGQGTSLALDAGGHAHIAYYDGASEDLKYAHWTGDGWELKVIDATANSGRFHSLRLDSTGAPHVCYQRVSTYDEYLRYARLSGGSWQILAPSFPNQNAGGWCALALDAQDRPFIAHRTTAGGSVLRITRLVDGTWSSVSVDSANRTGLFNSIAIDGSGRPHVSFYSDSEERLKYGD